MFKRMLCLGLMCCLLLSHSAAASNKKLEGTTEEDYDVRVYVIGNYHVTAGQESVKNCLKGFYNENGALVDILSEEDLGDVPLKNVRKTETASAIVISNEVSEVYLSEARAELETYLDMGYAVYFPNLTYVQANEAFKALVENPYNMTPVEEDNNSLITSYIFKDSDGEVYTGNIIASQSNRQIATDAAIVGETQINQTIMRNGKRQAQGGGSSFNDIGSSWNQIVNWHKNTYIGNFSGATWFSEWLAFYSTRLATGEHYYAWMAEWSIDSLSLTGARVYNSQVRYQTKADQYQTGGQLRAYEPKQTPKSGTISFSVGGNSDKKFNIGFSVSWPINELSVTDQSTSATEYCKVKWTFSGALRTSASTCSFSVIEVDSSRSGQYVFHHFRDAQRQVYNTDYYDIDTAQGNFYTTLNFVG